MNVEKYKSISNDEKKRMNNMSVYGYRFVKSNYSDANSTIDSSLSQLKSSITGLSNDISSF